MVSGFSDDHIIREIESRLNIVDIVAETIKLTRKGHRFWGLCPFHGEKTPSFTVSAERNMYYCFGCQSGGDLFSFVMKRDGLEFKEALQVLAARAGVDLPSSGPSRSRDKHKRMVELNQVAADFFTRILGSLTGREASQYLDRRSIEEATRQRFSLGYAPDSWSELSEYLLKKGFKPEEIAAAGLLKRSSERDRYYDSFRNRIMFPIYAYNGEIVGFGGRILDEGFPKYLNTGETELFQKRRNLYGLFQGRDSIRHAREVIVVEGYMDCLRLHQSGIDNSVATLGTALTQEQAQILLRYAERVLLMYDGDEAGQRQTGRAIEVLRAEGLKVAVLTLPDGKDPDDFIGQNGKEEFLNYIQNNRVSHIEYKINRQIMTHPARDIDSRIEIIRSIKDDILALDSEVEKDAYYRLLARKLGMAENVIVREIQAAALNQRKERASGNKTQLTRDNIIYGNYSNEEKILAAALSYPEVYRRIRAGLPGKCFSKQEYQDLFELYEDLHRNQEYTPLDFRIRAEKKSLGSVLGKIIVLSETLKPIQEQEVDEYINLVKHRGRRQRWNILHNRLEEAKAQGDFRALLGFILYLDSFLHNTQEGGI